MTEPTKPASSASWGLLLWVAVTLVVYALSPGPVIKVLGNNPPPAADVFLNTFYAPLTFLADYVPPVVAFYVWYMGLFGFPDDN